jgi:hypothetical protein
MNIACVTIQNGIIRFIAIACHLCIKVYKNIKRVEFNRTYQLVAYPDDSLLVWAKI